MSRAVQVAAGHRPDCRSQRRAVLSVTGTGQVRVSDVSKSATVVTEETQGTNLSLLKAGDVVRVEAPRGQIQRIVVLRRGWQELESPEK